MVLAIETSTNVCSVCLRTPLGDLFEKRSEGCSIHSEMLFLSVQELMNEHQFSINELDAVLVSSGPGSYTGLRIAASGVKGLLFDSDVKLYAVNTLASFGMSVLATNATCKTIHAVIDARRTHLYHQCYLVQDHSLIKKNELEVREISEIDTIIKPEDCIIGTGINRLNDNLVSQLKVYDADYITAKSLIKIFEEQPNSEWVQNEAIDLFEPNYFTSNQINNSNAK